MTVTQTMTYTVPGIEEVKASVDAALEALQTSLRELNREVGNELDRSGTEAN